MLPDRALPHRAGVARALLVTLSISATAVTPSCSCGGDESSGAGGGGGTSSASSPTSSSSSTNAGGGPLTTGSSTSTGPATACAKIGEEKTSTGCEFYAVEPPIIPAGKGACFAAFIANTSDAPAHVRVRHGTQDLPVANFARIPKGQGENITYEPFDSAAGLPPGEVLLLFLSRLPPASGGMLVDCPAPAALDVDAAVVGSGRGAAFRIETDQPVAAYQILPYGGASAAATSATLLLPTSTWGDNYVAVTPYAQSQLIEPGSVPENAVLIVGQESGTSVTILPTAAIAGGGGLDPAPAGQAKTYALGEGEFIQFLQGPELAGSVIKANKRVGVFGGASCMNIPTNVPACDTAQQQIPPVRALGSEYVGVRHPAREGVEPTTPWRLVGAVDGTQLTWEPTTPPGAPTSLSVGQVAEFSAAGPFVVRSQDDAHPFYAAGYMTSGQPYFGTGDPEWVNLVPTGQYLKSYVLLTDPTYSETSLVVVRKPSADGTFSDVELGCAGTLTGWQSVGEFEVTKVDIVKNQLPVGGCSNGRHELASTAPFAVTVWGWGHFVSYAYPGGAGIETINEVEVPPVPK